MLYEVITINYQPHIKKEEKEKSTKKNKGLLTRLGLAGFAFGNVMLLSFPDYLSADVILNQELIDSFKWLSLALSIPVMLYSADSYFITAWKILCFSSTLLVHPRMPLNWGTLYFRSVRG